MVTKFAIQSSYFLVETKYQKMVKPVCAKKSIPQIFHFAGCILSKKKEG
jgi:hypothetical protein